MKTHWNKLWILGFIASLVFSFLVWMWMLGFFAFSPAELNGSPAVVNTLAKWSRPGIMAIPVLASILIPVYASLRMRGKGLPWEDDKR